MIIKLKIQMKMIKMKQPKYIITNDSYNLVNKNLTGIFMMKLSKEYGSLFGIN
jgi:hypothetical protein